MTHYQKIEQSYYMYLKYMVLKLSNKKELDKFQTMRLFYFSGDLSSYQSLKEMNN